MKEISFKWKNLNRNFYQVRRKIAMAFMKQQIFVYDKCIVLASYNENTSMFHNVIED